MVNMQYLVRRERKKKGEGEDGGTDKDTESGRLPDTLKDFRRKYLPAP